jgi:hypothetical protein
MFHPILLTGVALVGLPILLHLIMKQEPKRLPFPAFRFLKQKQFTNQRKLRLRHLILMALRMGLILLIALALFQPSMVSEGFSLRTEQPVAAVMVIDTSPSMGYVISESRSGLNDARKKGIQLLEETLEGPWTLLDDARYRLLEILAELPSSSRVAILDPSERDEPQWSLTLEEARKKVRTLKKPRPSSVPMSRALERAYQLLARLDQESNLGEEGLPRLLCLFSDRTAASWDASRVEDLKKFRDRAQINPNTEEKYEIASFYFDVGVDKPAGNFAITTIEQTPQLISFYQPAVINVGIDSTLKEGKNVVTARIEKVGANKDFADVQQKTISLNPEGRASAEFRWNDLKPGVYQIEFRLENSDSVPFDNVRYWTFRVREPKKILTLVDAPIDVGLLGGSLGMAGRGQHFAGYFDLALRVKGWYSAEIVPVQEVYSWKPEEWAKFEAICLAGIAVPSEELWKRLLDYVEAGGKLLVFPSEELNPKEYQTPSAAKLLPAKFTKFVDLADTTDGIFWAWNSLNYNHLLLEPFGKWRELPNIDFFKNPSRTWRYWEVEPTNRESIIVPYSDAGEADQRHGAILEQNVKQGKVILLTTDWSLTSRPRSHNYPSTSLYLVMVNELVRYLLGDVQDRTFNSTNGQNVILKWPLETQPTNYYLSGPEIVGNEAILKREPMQDFLLLGQGKLLASGNFTVANEEQTWLEGFSQNTSTEESNLERVPVDSIEEVLGKDSVAPLQRDLKLSEVLKGKYGSNIELFPFLMICLLLFLAFENWLSNRFYPGAK